MHVDEVKRWVITSLIAAVILLHSAAVALLGALGADKAGARQGLFVISALLSAFGIGAIRMVHRRSPLSLWLLVAPVTPAVVYLIVLGWP